MSYGVMVILELIRVFHGMCFIGGHDECDVSDNEDKNFVLANDCEVFEDKLWVENGSSCERG